MSDRATACVEFDGTKDSNGYGRFRKDGKAVLAHRHAWEKANGKIPKGMCICHHCDNPPCINVDHLFMGTMADNMRDRKSKGRYNGEWNGRAKLTEKQVRKIRKLYAKHNLLELSEMFKTSYHTLWDIVRNVTWRHLK